MTMIYVRQAAPQACYVRNCVQFLWRLTSEFKCLAGVMNERSQRAEIQYNGGQILAIGR